MHEVGLAKQALDIAINSALKGGANRISKIKINIGALSGVEPDALEFAFSVLLKSTIAEDALVEFSIIPASFQCTSCKKILTPDEREGGCPSCGSRNITRNDGFGLRVASIEVV